MCADVVQPCRESRLKLYLWSERRAFARPSAYDKKVTRTLACQPVRVFLIANVMLNGLGHIDHLSSWMTRPSPGRRSPSPPMRLAGRVCFRHYNHGKNNGKNAAVHRRNCEDYGPFAAWISALASSLSQAAGPFIAESRQPCLSMSSVTGRPKARPSFFRVLNTPIELSR